MCILGEKQTNREIHTEEAAFIGTTIPKYGHDYGNDLNNEEWV
jgi:hypothetical protein